MKSHFCSQTIKYDGSQIRSLWAYEQFGIQDDSIVSFIGECDIKPQYMVDLEDLKKGLRIYSPLMLHFLIEHFDQNLDQAILRQRVFTSIIKEILETKTRRRLIRQGDDIFEGSAKLSISIATLTSVSAKIHFGINIETKGTPVKTQGLKHYQVPPKTLALTAMKRYIQEYKDMVRARNKVRWVR